MPKIIDIAKLNENKKARVDYKNLKKQFAKVSDPAAKKLLQEIYKIVLGE